MREQASDPYERLVQEWQFRREMVNYYSRILLRLTPNDNDASQRWRELNGRLSTALIELRQASDLLRRYEQEHATVSPAHH